MLGAYLATHTVLPWKGQAGGPRIISGKGVESPLPSFWAEIGPNKIKHLQTIFAFDALFLRISGFRRQVYVRVSEKSSKSNRSSGP